MSEERVPSYDVRTILIGEGKIRQEVDFVFDGVSQRVSNAVMDTKEAQLRNALIALGWTPPGDER